MARQPATAADLDATARLIFRNECNERPQCLVSWNKSEDFASLGIGHFIWYPDTIPAGQRRFSESFPQLLRFMRQHGVQIPAWLSPDSACPWPDREHFLAALDSERMLELRTLLQQTMPLQARFMRQRLANALPQMLDGLDPVRRQHVRYQFTRLMQSPGGDYALLDYVNFKGEGTNPKERYAGHGWGLRQVLLAMHGKKPGVDAVREFAAEAETLLRQRVRLAPPERHEIRWLTGWIRRLKTYVHEAERLALSTPSARH